MNFPQKLVVFLGLALIAGMVLVPPWAEYYQVHVEIAGQDTHRSSRQTDAPVVYAPLSSPPEGSAAGFEYRIEMSRLLVQCGAVMAVTLLALRLLSRKRGRDS